MRLPEVVIAAAFACGIALGWHPAVARYAASYILLSSFFFLLFSFFLFSYSWAFWSSLMARGWRSLASSHVQVWQTQQHQLRRRRQITSKTKRRNKKPTAACHS